MANTLAKATGAEVIVLHVSHAPVVASEGGSLLRLSRATARWRTCGFRFKKLQPTDPAVRVEHVTVVAERPSAAHVLEALEKAGCDLIVMGMHGHSWLRSRLFGSVTEEVVRQTALPRDGGEGSGPQGSGRGAHGRPEGPSESAAKALRRRQERRINDDHTRALVGGRVRVHRPSR